MTTDAARAAMPTEPARTRDPLASPEKASSAKARTGMPSFTKLFQMPATTSDTVVRDLEKPHELKMAYVRPTEMALPPGSVLATAVVDWVATMACRYLRPGVAATITSQ